MKIYKKSGIYKIENIITGDFYIGQSYNMYIRKYRHLSELSRNIHKNKFLQNSYNKYGKKSFKIVPIIYCENWELNKYEQFFINNIKPQFNMVLVVTDSRLGFKASEETKRKMSLIQSYNQNNKWWYSSPTEYLRSENILIKFSKKEIEKIKSIKNLDKEKLLFSIILNIKINNEFRKYKKEDWLNYCPINIKRFMYLSKFSVRNRYSKQEIMKWIYEFENKNFIKIENNNIYIDFLNKKILKSNLSISSNKKFIDSIQKYINHVGMICEKCKKRTDKNSTNQKYCPTCSTLNTREENKKKHYI